jgi:hypothetical protein
MIHKVELHLHHVWMLVLRFRIRIWYSLAFNSVVWVLIESAHENEIGWRNPPPLPLHSIRSHPALYWGEITPRSLFAPPPLEKSFSLPASPSPTQTNREDKGKR